MNKAPLLECHSNTNYCFKSFFSVHSVITHYRFFFTVFHSFCLLFIYFSRQQEKTNMCWCSYIERMLTVASVTGSTGKGGGRDMLHHYKVNCIAAAQTSFTPSFWYSNPHSDKITQHMSSFPIRLSSHRSLSRWVVMFLALFLTLSLSISLCNWVYYGTGGNEHHGHGSMRIEREREREREQNATAASGNNKKRLRRRKTVLCPRREERRGRMTAVRARHNIEMKTSTAGSWGENYCVFLDPKWTPLKKKKHLIWESAIWRLFFRSLTIIPT